MSAEPQPAALAHHSRGMIAIKRAVDIVGAVLGLALLAPVMAVVAVLIKLDSPGPVFYRQERVGWKGRRFRIYKFRSMVVGVQNVGTALTVRADRRITRVGAFLRRKKIDELPQLLNVLLGEMSLVGPRPEVPEFMSFYTPQQRALIVSMRPGLTDYAAICFHDESSLLDGSRDPVEVYRRKIMPIKFAYYDRYSHEIGIFTDFRLILATILMLITGRVPRFLGRGNEVQQVAPTAADEPRIHVAHAEAQVGLSVEAATLVHGEKYAPLWRKIT
jgi:lipopolysaccharide/colanic/teichoic acid biosynthesis glycosyltransferase